MSGISPIEWTEKVWNPSTGCTKIAPECAGCYAFTLHDRRHKAYLSGKPMADQYAKPFREVQLFHDRLREPLTWRKPQKIFVDSMSDLFHPDVPFEFIAQVYHTMRLASRHIFQVLTKRPDRAREFFEWYRLKVFREIGEIFIPAWNVWLGMSAGTRRTFNKYIQDFRKCPAAMHFISFEPLLEFVDVADELIDYDGLVTDIDWVIVGGETGAKARPMHPDWARAIKYQCHLNSVPFFFKQWGDWAEVDYLHATHVLSLDGTLHEYVRGSLLKDDESEVFVKRVGKKAAGRLLDGRLHDEFPVQSCGCCGRDSVNAWCNDCLPHLDTAKYAPWEMTYSFQHEGQPCPLRLGGNTDAR